MTKQELLKLISQHGLQDIKLESHVLDEGVVMFVVRLILKNGQDFTLEQDAQTKWVLDPKARIQESVEGNLEPRFHLRG